MKKSFLLIATLVAGLTYSSCDQTKTDDPSNTPVFSVDSKTIYAGYNEGQYTISYTLSSPASDGQILPQVPDDCDWISEFSTAENLISFNVAANNGDERKSVITVSYTYSGGEPQTYRVNVVQSAYGEEPPVQDDPITEEGFTVSVTDITFSTAVIDITPDDPAMTYIIFVVQQSQIDGMSDDDIFYEDMTIMESMAALFEIDLKSYLERFRLSVGHENRKQGNLNPDTDYYVYCYGIDNSGDYPVRSTGIVKYPFTTKSQEITENSITLDVEITGNLLSAIATPYTNDRWFVLNWNREDILTQRGYTDGTPAERCEAFEYTENISYYMNWGFSLDVLAWQGPQTVSVTMTTSDTYYVYAYFVNSQGQCDSDIVIATIEFDGTTGVLQSPAASPDISLLREVPAHKEGRQNLL